MIPYCASILAALALVWPARAEEWLLDLDPERAQIHFSLKATLHTVEGSLDLSSASLRVDIETGSAGGEIVLDAASATTEHAARDRKMHQRVLRSTEFPRIVFFPERLTGDLNLEGESIAVVHGEVELVGRRHSAELPIQVTVAGGEVIATGTLEVPYVEWGLEDPSTFLLKVAKIVQARLEVAGTLRREPSVE